jgi:hypothetical protein
MYLLSWTLGSKRKCFLVHASPFSWVAIVAKSAQIIVAGVLFFFYQFCSSFHILPTTRKRVGLFLHLCWVGGGQPKAWNRGGGGGMLTSHLVGGASHSHSRKQSWRSGDNGLDVVRWTGRNENEWVRCFETDVITFYAMARSVSIRTVFFYSLHVERKGRKDCGLESQTKNSHGRYGISCTLELELSISILTLLAGRVILECFFSLSRIPCEGGAIKAIFSNF